MKFKPTAFSLFLIATFLVVTLKSNAQNQDSLVFAHAKWQTKTVKKGIKWKQANITGIFNSQQEINILEIDLKKQGKNIRLAALGNSLEKTSALAQKRNAVVAINGGFFDTRKGGAVDFIKVDNQIINTTIRKSDRANAYFAFNNKKVQIENDSIQITDCPNILLSGPQLLNDGKPNQLSKNAFNDNRHPRTAVGLNGNTLILITIDGRNASSHGVNLTELSNLLRWHGCKDAMNLDGGGSTTMYIKGQPDSGIVNYPSDNKRFDHEGERAVANIIYFIN